MTLDELSSKLDELQIELEKAPKIKAASKRARALLNEIKQSATSIKRELIALDEKH